MRRCSVCRLAINSGSEPRLPTAINVSGATCRECYLSLLNNPPLPRVTADLKARQARRRELQKQLLPDLLRKHAANRAEIAKKFLTFVGFDLPGQ